MRSTFTLQKTFAINNLSLLFNYFRLNQFNRKGFILIIISLNIGLSNIFAQPTITDFIPKSAKPGDPVMIVGTNFSNTLANNIVFFGATRATVTASTLTSLTVTVPFGATYGPITALNTGTNLAAYSMANFIPVYSPAKNAITSTDFSPKVDFATGTFPNKVATGDLDGDGKPDLVAINLTSNTVSVYRNTSSNGNIGVGSFATKVDFAAGDGPQSIAIGDLDGDGKLDLAVANFTTNNVSIFRNTSTSGSITTGSFAAKVDFSVGAGNPRSVAIGDLDGDGKLDLAVVSQGIDNLSIFRNTSTSGAITTGSFAAKVDFTTSVQPFSIAIGDLDGDRKLDLAVANLGTNSVSIFRNTSTSGSITAGSFANLVNYQTGNSPMSIKLGDLDGDGKLDLAVANSASANISILRNNIPSIGPLNPGSFEIKVDFLTGTDPQDVAFADLDGDGKIDLGVVNQNSKNVSVFRNISTTNTITTGSLDAKIDFATGASGFPNSLIFGDLDGDGKPDLAVPQQGSNVVSIFRNADIISTNANLSAMILSTGTLAPVFASGTIAYTANVPNATTSITVTPTRAEANATIQIRVNNGTYATVASGTASSALTLNVGANTIDVRVTAQDGITQKTYTTTVTRAVSNNADLSAMTFSAGTITPIFASGTTAYTANVPNATASITVTPTRAEANATIQVRVNNGTYATVASGTASSALTLNVGANTVDVMVTAQDGVSQKTYTTTVTRAGSDNANLSALTLTVGTLSPTFASGTVAYTTTVPNATTSIAVTPTREQANATIQVQVNNDTYTTTASGSQSRTLALNTGTNTINIRVTAQDGTTQKTYSITVTRAPAPPIFTSFSLIATKPSDQVSITGGGFTTTPDNYIVSFGATRTTVTALSPLSMLVTVPNGATYFPINIYDKQTGLSTNSLNNFIPIFSPAKTGIGSSDFSAKVDITAGTRPFHSAISDLDGDGKPDLIVANRQSNSISILRNISTNGSITAGSFAPKVDFTVGTEPVFVATGDIDGDGKPDIAVVNINSNSISILRNTATSGSISATSFAAGVDFTTGNQPFSLAIGDLDADGKADMAVVNNTLNTISLYRNTSTNGTINVNSFSARVDFSTGTGSNPISIAIGDLNGDSKPDMVVANQTTNNISIFQNSVIAGFFNVGSFLPKVDISTGASAQSVALGDLDRDGKLDIAVANNNGIVSVFRNINNAGGIFPSSFESKVDFSAGGRGLAIGDLTGDGKPEMVSVNLSVGSVSILTNNTVSGSISSSSFSTKVDFTTGEFPFSTAIGDLDGDSKPDLVIGYNNSTNLISVLRNVDPPPTPPTITSFTQNVKPGDPVSIVGTNFNTSAANNIVFFGATRATVTAITTGFSTSVLTVIVPTGATYGPISVLNTGNGLTAYSLSNFNPIYSPAKTSITTRDFAPKVDFASGSNPFSVVIGDFDGDGKPDMAVASSISNSFVSVYRNTSTTGSINTGSFADKIDFSTGSSPYVLSMGDLDGDGKPDLAIANTADATISVLRNTSTIGSISFAARVNFPTGTGPYSVAIGDLDGDGKPDLAVANFSSNTVSVYRNNSTLGSISFSAKVDFTTGTNPRSVSIGDLDGDSKPDLAVANITSNNVSVFRNTSTRGSIDAGSFAAKVDFTTGDAVSVTIGDLDGDGKSDLVVANYISNSISLLRNTANSGSIGPSSFAAKVDFETGTLPYLVSLSDFDGDGKPDLAVANSGSGFVSVYRNTATSGILNIASLAPRVDLITIGGQRSIAIGDLDGDGRPDIAVPNYTLNAASVLQNILPSNTINSTGTLTTLNTTYGTASSNTSFSVSGSSLTANILVTSPSGFEVSTSSTSGFAASVTLPQVSGTVAATTIFVRLSATTPVGNYSGNIVLSSTGASNVNVPTLLSTVTAKALTITGLTANNKIFDGNTTTTLSGTPTLVGVVGSDNVTVTGTPVATFVSSAVGNNIAVTVTGFTISGIAASNYTITQPTGLTANITSATITLTGTLTAFSSCISTPSSPQNFTVSGTNLVGNISLAAPTGYELSTSATGTYSSSIALTPASGTVANTTIFVRLNRATLGSIPGNIVASSTNANNQTLGVSGTVNAFLTLAPITGAQQVCFASTTPFTSTTTGGVWSSNNTTAATVNATTGIVTGMQSGTATISYAVTNNAGGCVTTVTKDITVNPLPLITASTSSTVVLKGQTTQLNVSAVGNIASFVWSPSGGTLTTNPASTTVRVTQNTTYTVTATSTAGCVNTANVVVTTKDEVYVETVNVFSPNGDGINDRFVIKNLDLYPNNKLQVFDRTGKIIYEQNNYANTWDGYVNGKLLTKDTYFYVLTVNGLIVKKATITLIR